MGLHVNTCARYRLVGASSCSGDTCTQRNLKSHCSTEHIIQAKQGRAGRAFIATERLLEA